MQTIDINQLKTIVKDVVIDLEEPVMIEGGTGIGKSEAIAQACAENDAIIVDVRLGQYDSVDLRGFPGVDKATGQTVWYAPKTLPFVGNDEFPDDKIIVLFLDELTSATPPVFAVAYQLINDFCIGEHVLKPNVRIIAAGNRASDRGVVNRMPIPLCNRMTWFGLGHSVQVWCEYAQSVGVPAMFIAFMNFRKNLLHTFDSEKPEKVVATPRTWMKAVKYYQSPMAHDLKVAAMKGAVGDGPVDEFWGFHDIWHKVVPVKTIIADPTGCPVPDEESMKYATAVSVSGAMKKSNMTPLYTFMKRMDPEYVILAMQLAVSRDKTLFEVNEFIDFSKRYRVVFS